MIQTILKLNDGPRCPRCGAADMPICSECEINERWIKRYQAEVAENTLLSSQVESMAIRIESLSEELDAHRRLVSKVSGGG